VVNTHTNRFALVEDGGVPVEEGGVADVLVTNYPPFQTKKQYLFSKLNIKYKLYELTRDQRRPTVTKISMKMFCINKRE
jgi:hypothetical protein